MKKTLKVLIKRVSLVNKTNKTFKINGYQKRNFPKTRKISIPYTEVGSHQTKITASLWLTRKGENEVLNPQKSAKYSPTKILEKSPKESFTEVNYPFKTDLGLQEQYINPYGTVRLGRIFEDMDAMAGNVAFSHADDNDPTTVPLKIVTASVDRIQLVESIGVGKDLSLQGFVRWVGSSSMEIDVNIYELPDTKDGVRKKLLNSRFVMVALDAFTNRATRINTLKLETVKDKARFEIGEKNAIRRKEERKNSLQKIPPQDEEVKLLHNLFMNIEQNLEKKDMIHIEETKTKTLFICQPTERNLNNTIFGGFLMRKAYHLGFATAFKFLRKTPIFKSLERINFIKPVHIGDFFGII